VFVTAMMFYTGCGYFVVSMGLNLAIQCGIVPRAGLHYSGVRRVAPSGASLPQKLSEIIAPMSGAGAAHTHTAAAAAATIRQSSFLHRHVGVPPSSSYLQRELRMAPGCSRCRPVRPPTREAASRGEGGGVSSMTHARQLQQKRRSRSRRRRRHVLICYLRRVNARRSTEMAPDVPCLASPGPPLLAPPSNAAGASEQLLQRTAWRGTSCRTDGYHEDRTDNNHTPHTLRHGIHGVLHTHADRISYLPYDSHSVHPARLPARTRLYSVSVTH